MPTPPFDTAEEQFVIWNGKLGVRDFVMIDRVEIGANGPQAWLEEPYGMVGPYADFIVPMNRMRFDACYNSKIF